MAAVDRRASGRRTLEEYRYDPLGRRVWVSTQTWCAPSSTVECLTSGVQRVVWDGAALVAEVRAPVVGGNPAVEERDTGFPAPRAVTLAVGAVEPSAFTGRVVYGPGRAVDQPVSVTRYEYTDNPAGTALVWPRFTWAVLWDYRGSPVAGLYTSGAWQRPYAPGPTQSECAPLGAPGLRRCVRVQWGFAQTAYDRAKEALTPVAWHGSLLAHQRDGSGLEAKRARLYDPATGRFTQEDPIGLAGGLNLYGYANGDPVNFSDPFGLCPMCIAHAIYEVGSSLYDAYDLAKTGVAYLRGKASGAELSVTAAGAAIGVVSVGGGLGRAGRFAVREAASDPRLWKKLAFEELLPDAEKGVAMRTIAGHGSSRAIDEVARLTGRYGGEAGDWAKKVGATRSGPGGISQQIHWYENVRTGQRVEFKPTNPY